MPCGPIERRRLPRPTCCDRCSARTPVRRQTSTAIRTVSEQSGSRRASTSASTATRECRAATSISVCKLGPAAAWSRLAVRTNAAVSHGWAGLTQRIGRLTLAGTLGQARLESHDLVTYSGSMRVVPSDSLRVLAREAVDVRGDLAAYRRPWLEPLIHRGQVEWTPAIRYVVAADASYEELSDGNERWEMFVAPRAAVARTEHLNLDLGLLAHRFGATQRFAERLLRPAQVRVLLGGHRPLLEGLGEHRRQRVGSASAASATTRRRRSGSVAMRRRKRRSGSTNGGCLKVHGEHDNQSPARERGVSRLQQRTRAVAAFLTGSRADKRRSS